jgi:hypothetical protein
MAGIYGGRPLPHPRHLAPVDQFAPRARPLGLGDLAAHGGHRHKFVVSQIAAASSWRFPRSWRRLCQHVPVGRYDSRIADLEGRVYAPCPCCDGTGRADVDDDYETPQERVARLISTNPEIAHAAEHFTMLVADAEVIDLDDPDVVKVPRPPRPPDPK